jgi:DnaJ-class molecular chaperone
MTHADLLQALEVLGLSGRATLKEIRQRHRLLVKRYHPDAGDGSDPEVMRRINEAYARVSAYIAAYRYDFSEAEFYEQNPEERLRRQFFGDPLWGGN